MAIERALELRPALEKLFAMPTWDKRGKEGLRSCRLTDEEWDVLSELSSVLGVSQNAFFTLSFEFASDVVNHIGLPLCYRADFADEYPPSSPSNSAH